MVSVSRDMNSLYRKLREIYIECRQENIGILELARINKCKFDLEDEDGRFGNALHHLVGKEDINGVPPDCIDSEIKTYQLYNETPITIRTLKDVDLNCGHFDNSTQFMAMRRIAFISLEDCPFNADDRMIYDWCGMDITNKSGPLYEEALRCWNFAVKKACREKPDSAARIGAHRLNNGLEIKDTGVIPALFTNMVQRGMILKTPPDMMYFVDRKSASEYYRPLFRMRRDNLRNIRQAEYEANNYQHISRI